ASSIEDWHHIRIRIAGLSNSRKMVIDPAGIAFDQWETKLNGGSKSDLQAFANEIIDYGVSTIFILPLLLLAGVHVSEDIPHEVDIAQSKLQNLITLRILPHLGSHSLIPDLLTQQFEKYTDRHFPRKQARILVSHGSRRAEANQVMENLANSSQAIAAYWGIEPKVETQIECLIAQGVEHINVLPYFLTEGGITEAIARKLQTYSDRLQIRQLPVPLSNEQLVNLALSIAVFK
ncbi:MAG: CbiX/SirB N-terminal domain-containing protein, partial [Pseudanabaena sp.]